MRTIYIGGSGTVRKGGVKWKLYLFLFAFLAVTGAVLKVAAPTIVEKWINQKGADSTGYAFSIRDSELSLSRGQVVLSDVKVFNPETSAEILEAPQLTIKFNWMELLRSEEKNISVLADSVDLTLSKDFSSEIKRIGELNRKSDLHFNLIQGNIAKLNVIEQKEDQSRTVVELSDVSIKVRDVSPLSINKKTEFSITSKVVDGGKLNLTGKTAEANGSTPWSIQGSLKKVRTDLLNKIAGDKLPFSFHEPTLNAEIIAQSEQGRVSGEILPDVAKVNLIDERPGFTHSIKRVLTDELTFTLPFTLKDELTVEYSDTFSKLRNYRKYSGPAQTSTRTEAPKTNKSSSFWPF